MTTRSKLNWFGRKRVGIGIRPTHIMGWLFTIVLIFAVIIGLHLIVVAGSILQGACIVIAAIILYSIVVASTFAE